MMLDSLYQRNVDPQSLGKTLQAARARSKLTQQAVAESLGVIRQNVIDWEKGKHLPQQSELIALAALYGRSVHELLQQKMAIEPIQLQLRASRRLDETLEKELDRKRYEFQELCEDYLVLEKLRSAPLPPTQAPLYALTGDRLERLAEDAATAERNRLGLGDAPIINLREVLENEGIRIFYFELPGRIAGFYGANAELGPCMGINRKHPSDRMRWSLVHEYAHFLTNRYQAEIVVYYTYREVPEHERFVDAFARAFLMPASRVSRQYHEMKRSRGTFLPADLILMAHYFFVSFEAMALRLEDLHLARPGTHESLIANGFRPGEAKAKLQIEPYSVSNQMLPLRYQYLATEALLQGDISEDEYATFLRSERVNARHVAQSIRTRVSQSASGEVGEIEVPFTGVQGA